MKPLSNTTDFSCLTGAGHQQESTSRTLTGARGTHWEIIQRPSFVLLKGDF